MTKLTDIDNLNCHDAHVRAGEHGDELHYGWALGPGEVRYQHCWLVRAGRVIDLFGWTEHEDHGVRLRIAKRCDCNQVSFDQLGRVLHRQVWLRRYRRGEVELVLCCDCNMSSDVLLDEDEDL